MESLQNLKTELIQWSYQPADSAARMTLSDARAHLESDAFEKWRKWRDTQSELLQGINGRLDVLIKAPR